MTRDKILACHKVLADFLGYKELSDGTGRYEVSTLGFHPIGGGLTEKRKYLQLKEMQFYRSYDWLMRAVKPCLKLCNDNELCEWEEGFSNAFLSGEPKILLEEAANFIEFAKREGLAKSYLG